MERLIENAMYAARWLLAPIYFGLSLALLALVLKFFQEVFHVLPRVFELAEIQLILVLLSLVDMALVGGLLVMVMISGNPNVVTWILKSECSRIWTDDAAEDSVQCRATRSRARQARFATSPAPGAY